LCVWNNPPGQPGEWNLANNSLPWHVIVLAHAIELAIREPGFSFANITPRQIEAAALVALRYADSLPNWLDPLYRAHTKEVESHLFTLIKAEGELETDHPRVSRSLPHAGILKEELIEVAHRFLLGETLPKNVAVLEALLQLAIRRPDSSLTSLIAAETQKARRVMSSADERQRRRPMLLLAAWWLLDWKPAWIFASKHVLFGAGRKERLFEFVGAMRGLLPAPAFRDSWPATISNEATITLLPKIYRALPPGRTDRRLGVHTVTPTEELRRIRDAMVRHVSANDPALAIRALKQWINKREFQGHRTWFRHILSDLEKRLTDETWETPSPQEVSDALFRNCNLIRGLEDFVNFVAGVLDQDIPKHLYDDASLVPQVAWKGTKRASRKPGGEKILQQLLANIVKPLLKSRHIIFAREPELLDAKKPEMRFSVALPNGLQLHIPCEVKRAHAQDLWSAPVDQLAKRYMREPEVRYGFYLVGWYGIRTPPDPTHRKKYADPHHLQSALQIHIDDAIGKQNKKVIPIVYDLTL